MTADRPRLLIIGGGFAGASAAVQAARRSPIALEITIVEPQAELGRGLAYRGSDPDHRVNGTILTHSIDPLDVGHLARWVDRERLLESDPLAECELGVFVRRSDYGRYLHESVLEHARENASGSSITHRRARVADLAVDPGVERSADAEQIEARLDDGGNLQVNAALLAIGNPPARVPEMLRDLIGHRALVTDPLTSGRLRELPRDEPVLVMGTSLTAADVIATLLRQGHHGPITAFSRRGLRPQAQRPRDPSNPSSPPSEASEISQGLMIDRINGPVPAFLAPVPGEPQTVRRLCRALRQRIAQLIAAGEPWQAGFDELRDVVWQVWPQLADDQKRRFMRQLRVWYDVARFRIPPQTSIILERAIGRGQLSFVAQSLQRVEARDERHLRLHLGRGGRVWQQDVAGFVNCTGLDIGGPVDPDSLAGRLLGQGVLVRDGSGIGYRVDARCRPIGARGDAPDRLRLIGPATAGVFGDTLGAAFIAAQVDRLLPDLFGMMRGIPVARD